MAGSRRTPDHRQLRKNGTRFLSATNNLDTPEENVDGIYFQVMEKCFARSTQ